MNFLSGPCWKKLCLIFTGYPSEHSFLGIWGIFSFFSSVFFYIPPPSDSDPSLKAQIPALRPKSQP